MQTIYVEQIELLLKNDTSTCEKVGVWGSHKPLDWWAIYPLQSMFWNSSSSRNNAYKFKSIWSSASRYIFHNVKVVLLRAGQITLATSILKYKSTATVRD
jgi:hypothetical protein